MITQPDLDQLSANISTFKAGLDKLREGCDGFQRMADVSEDIAADIESTGEEFMKPAEIDETCDLLAKLSEWMAKGTASMVEPAYRICELASKIGAKSDTAPILQGLRPIDRGRIRLDRLDAAEDALFVLHSEVSALVKSGPSSETLTVTEYSRLTGIDKGEVSRKTESEDRTLANARLHTRLDGRKQRHEVKAAANEIKDGKLKPAKPAARTAWRCKGCGNVYPDDECHRCGPGAEFEPVTRP
ncbi:MAG TPA: hypothetical protein VH518_04140 [Tepidisphaeraceae bacterium]|jgi:hypothetical protein